mgnify:CR=1 FL=1
MPSPRSSVGGRGLRSGPPCGPRPAGTGAAPHLLSWPERAARAQAWAAREWARARADVPVGEHEDEGVTERKRGGSVYAEVQQRTQVLAVPLVPC